MRIETGKIYLLAYGGGSQLFYVSRISSRGKPFGWRYNASRARWEVASLKVKDSRLGREWPASYTPEGKTLTIPPSTFTKKADLTDLTNKVAELELARERWYQDNPEPGSVGRGASAWEKEVKTAQWKAYWERYNAEFGSLSTLARALRIAEGQNKNVARKGDLKSFEWTTDEEIDKLAKRAAKSISLVGEGEERCWDLEKEIGNLF